MGTDEALFETTVAQAEEREDLATRDTEFDLKQGFTAGEIGGGFALGGLEVEYEQLFTEALEDGVITSDERSRLDKAADNMGLDRLRMNRLEQAMIQLYESDRRVKVVERWEAEPQSLAPLQVQADGDAGRILLLKQLEVLKARVKELEEELREARAHVNVEVDLSALDESAVSAEDVTGEDVAELRARIRRSPTNPEAHARLYQVFKSQGDVDGQFCAAQSLVVLEAASEAQQTFYEQHRRRTLLTPASGLNQDAWRDLLMHPEQEILTGNIFGLIAPAVLLGRVTSLRREKKLHVPDPALRQDPAVSTLTAVRALTWGATILGLPAPAVFLEKDRDAGFVHVPGVPPFTVLGKGVLSGRNQIEHAFLVGRHMTLYRQEHFVKTLFSAVVDLEDLFLAALLIGSPGLPIAEAMKRRVEPISRAIEPMLEPAQLDLLRGHFLRFVEDGGRTNLMRWSDSVSKTACRAGLLLCGDLCAAMNLLSEEPGDPAPLKTDLLAFVVGERYAKLRKLLGVNLAPGSGEHPKGS